MKKRKIRFKKSILLHSVYIYLILNKSQTYRLAQVIPVENK